jgi:hypothetical protein
MACFATCTLDGKSKGPFIFLTRLGFVFYFAYGFWRSNLSLGIEHDEPLAADRRRDLRSANVVVAVVK